MSSPQSTRVILGLAVCAATLAAQTQLSIVNSTFPPGAVGQVYSQALQANGGTLTTYLFRRC